MQSFLTDLSNKTVLIIGCGGLGCNVCEYLSRSGVEKIILVDGDVFEPSNLNRQLYANKNTLGEYKVNTAKEQIASFSDTIVVAIADYFPTDRLEEYQESVDIIVDCLDNVSNRIELEEYAEQLGVPLVHGAINGTIGQVTTIYPQDRVLSKLYNSNTIDIEETLAYVPSLVASLQSAEVIKYFNDLPTLRGYLLMVDLEEAVFHKVKL